MTACICAYALRYPTNSDNNNNKPVHAHTLGLCSALIINWHLERSRSDACGHTRNISQTVQTRSGQCAHVHKISKFNYDMQIAVERLYGAKLWHAHTRIPVRAFDRCRHCRSIQRTAHAALAPDCVHSSDKEITYT